MPLTQPALWTTIRDLPLPYRAERDEMAEPARLCRRFEDNLRKAGDWTDESAERLTAEYRRFLYLWALDGTLAPSPVLNEVWRLHLSMANDWDARFWPAIEGASAQVRTRAPGSAKRGAYPDILASYLREFDSDPPADIWPGPAAVRRARVWGWLAWVFGAICALLFFGTWVADWAAPFQVFGVSLPSLPLARELYGRWVYWAWLLLLLGSGSSAGVAAQRSMKPRPPTIPRGE